MADKEQRLQDTPGDDEPDDWYVNQKLEKNSEY